MKKVFLLLTSALFGIAAMAGNWTKGDGTVTIPYNNYGNGDSGSGEVSYSWQGGNTSVIDEAVEEAIGEDFDSWSFAKQQVFQLEVEGSFNAAGTFKTGIVDESKEAGYWFQNSDFASPEVKVAEGETFSQTFIYTINALATEDKGTAVNTPGLVLGFEMADYAAATTFNGQAPSEDLTSIKDVVLTFTKFNFTYVGDLSIYDNPYALSNNGVAEVAADGYKYQGSFTFEGAKVVAAGDYFNFEISGKATQDISSLMIALWDTNPAATPKAYANSLCGDAATGEGMATIAANIVKDEAFTVKASLPINIASQDSAGALKVVFLGQSQYEGAQIILDLSTFAVELGADKGYGVPSLAVEAISADEAIVNGVIYASEIVIYNAQGQVVATAANEFSINTLAAGVYFAKTSKGAFSFSVK